MGFLTEKEKKEDFLLIKETLHSINIISDIIEKGEITEEIKLLIALPDLEKETNNEEISGIAVCYLFQLEDFAKARNKYLFIYSELDEDLEGIEALALYHAVYLLNTCVAIGYFYVQKEEEYKIKYRYTIGSIQGKKFDEGIIGEAIIELSFYMKIASEVVQALKKNLDIADYLNNLGKKE